MAGEQPLQTAQRELAEEIGKAADALGADARVLHLRPASPTSASTCSSPPACATSAPQAEEDERIEIVRWPLERLDEAIAECHDAKSLIGLLSLAQQLGRRGPSGPA